MHANIGGADRAIRIILGLALLGLYFILDGEARYLAFVGIVPLATALTRWCPLYPLFGINTCGTKR